MVITSLSTLILQRVCTSHTALGSLAQFTSLPLPGPGWWLLLAIIIVPDTSCHTSP